MALLGNLGHAQLVPTSWTGNGEDWSNTAKWSLGLVPLATNSAQISSGTVVVSDARVASLYGGRALRSLRRAGIATDLVRIPRGERSFACGSNALSNTPSRTGSMNQHG